MDMAIGLNGLASLSRNRSPWICQLPPGICLFVQEVDSAIQDARTLDPRVESAYKWFELRSIACAYGIDDFAVSDTRMPGTNILNCTVCQHNDKFLSPVFKIVNASSRLLIAEFCLLRPSHAH